MEPNPAPKLEFYKDFDPEELEVPPFDKAIEKDDVALVERLLSLGVPPDTRANHYENTPLLMALSMRSLRCARILLDAGANINALSAQMGSAHQQAVFFGQDGDEALALVESRGLKFQHASHAAAYHGKIAELELLSVEELMTEDTLGLISIHYAAAGGSVPVLKLLLERLPAGSASRKSRFRGRAPVHCAILRDRVDAIEFLLANGASAAEVDGRGDNLLILAARLGRLQSLKWVLAHKLCDIEAFSDEMGDTALSIGALNGQIEIVECLLDNGAKVDALTRPGLTPLLRQLQGCDMPEITRLLVKRGANLHFRRRGPQDTTAVSCAITGGNPYCLVALLDEFGLTVEPQPPPVNLACGEGYITVAKFLMTRGWTLNEVEESSKLPVMCYAALGGSIAAMKWLRRQGVRFDKQTTPTGTTVVHAAAAINSVPILQMLLESGELGMDTPDQQGVTPIMTGASRGSTDAVNFLVEHGAALWFTNVEGGTVLLALCSGGMLSYVQRMHAERPGCLMQPDMQGNTALHYTVVYPTGLPVLRWLITEMKFNPSVRNGTGVTPLMAAAETANFEVMKLLVAAGASVLEKDNENTGVVHYSANKGNLECFKYVLEHGAKPTDLTNEGDSPLTIAIKAKSFEVAKYLIENCKINPNQTYSDMNFTPLMVACAADAPAIARYLLDECKANRSDRDEGGRTPLLYAASGGSLEIVQLLLQRGAKVRERDTNDFTALHSAAEKGHREVCELLIKEGADPKDRTREGADCVLTACHGGQLALLQWLVQDLGCSLDTEDKSPNRPVHCAAASSCLPVLRYVLDAMPGELNVTNGNGHTPLDICAFKGSVPCVRYLLSKGCVVNNIDPNGNTTAHMAAVSGNAECLKVLLHAGALHAHLNNDGISPLVLAHKNGAKRSIRVYHEFLMFKAAEAGDMDRVRELHETYGVPLDCADDKGRSLFDAATTQEVRDYLKPPPPPPERFDPLRLAIAVTIVASIVLWK